MERTLPRKEKERKEDKLKYIEKRIEKISKVIKKTKPEKVRHAEEKIITKKKEEFQLPKWVKYPWMYTRPRVSSQVKSWCDEWSKLILSYASFYKIYTIDIAKLLQIYPFDKLAIEDIRLILDYMVKKNLAKWVEKEKRNIKIIWQSDDEWARFLYQWALENALPRIEIFDLIKKFQMPPEDARRILEIMVKKGYATFIGEKRKIIEIEV